MKNDLRLCKIIKALSQIKIIYRFVFFFFVMSICTFNFFKTITSIEKLFSKEFNLFFAIYFDQARFFLTNRCDDFLRTTLKHDCTNNYLFTMTFFIKKKFEIESNCSKKFTIILQVLNIFVT